MDHSILNYALDFFDEDNQDTTFESNEITSEADDIIDFSSIHSVHSNVSFTFLLSRNTQKSIIAFGTIFNDIHIRHRDGGKKQVI